MRPSIRIWLNSKIYEYMVDGLSLASSPLSSSLMCLRKRNITPTQNNKVPQSESAVSHEASICSVHWQCRLDMPVLKFNIKKFLKLETRSRRDSLLRLLHIFCCSVQHSFRVEHDQSRGIKFDNLRNVPRFRCKNGVIASRGIVAATRPGHVGSPSPLDAAGRQQGGLVECHRGVPRGDASARVDYSFPGTVFQCGQGGQGSSGGGRVWAAGPLFQPKRGQRQLATGGSQWCRE